MPVSSAMHILVQRVLGVASLACLCVGATSVSAAPRVFDITDFGAVADGETLATAAIQKAIDACAEKGGGTVYLPPGAFRSGTLHLKSHVTLCLESGCTLLGSENLDDYPPTTVAVRSYTDNYVNRSLIAGENLDDVAIRGRGTIDGNGAKYHGKQYLLRPYVIRLVNCRDVLVEGVTLRSSPMWMQHYLACDRVRIQGVTVFNHVTWNNDALDIDGCRDVIVSDSNFDSDDDAITLKSTLDRPCENVTVTNCIVSSHCSAIKMGTESNGGFKNITITNCAICSCRFSELIGGCKRGRAGIALLSVDGGSLERVAITNVTIDGVTTPIFLRLGNRARPFSKDAPKPDVGTLRNVVLSNIVATNASKIGCPIAGIPGHPIENVTLSNVRIEFEGGGTKKDADRKIPEKETEYPECVMFDKLPAYGFYCRHVKGLRLDNVQLTVTSGDERPAMVFDDAERVLIDGTPR